MTKTKKLKIVYWIVYFAILVATAFFIYFLISNAIIQKQARDYYEQSWQYVADTNLELVTEENEDGTTTKKPEEMMQNFWDNIDAWMDELDSLYDTYNENLTSPRKSGRSHSSYLFVSSFHLYQTNSFEVG